MQPQPPPGPPPARARGRVALVVVGVAALVVGLVLGWLLPSPLGSDGDASAAGLHGQACDLAAASFPEDVDGDDGRIVGGPRAFELAAIGDLAQAAAAKDDSFADAGEAGATVYQGLSLADLDRINSGLADLRATC